MKKALITGAGRGIGRATALALAGMGYEIYANYVGNTQAAEETKALIEKNGGVLENVVVGGGAPVKRYWITLK